MSNDRRVNAHLFLAATLRVRSFPIAAFFRTLLLRITSGGARGSLAQVFGQFVDLLLEFLASYFQIFNSHGLAERAQIHYEITKGVFSLCCVASRCANFFPGYRIEEKAASSKKRASMRNPGATLRRQSLIMHRNIRRELHRKIIFNGSP